MDLWETLRPHVESGNEDEKVELKQQVSLSLRPERAELARDIAAMANTAGGDGYIVVGVVDTHHRVSGRPEDYVVGFSCPDKDEFRRTIGESLASFCNPPPKVSLREFVHPPTGRTIGVIVVARSFTRPHTIKRASGDVQEDEIWVRRGPACARANRDEIKEMCRTQRRVTVVSLSHPLTDPQREALGLELNCTIEEVIHRPLKLDLTHPFREQVAQALDDLGMTPHAWESGPIVVCLPSLSEATAVLLAELHGRSGHFPTIVRRRPVSEQGTTGYELAEIIDLQVVRDESRRDKR